MNPEFKKELLQNFFPEECYMIEPENLDLIVSKDVEIKRSDYGSNLDMFEVFTILVGALSLVDNTINIIRFYKEKNNKQPTIEEVQAELPKEKDSILPKEKEVSIIYYLITKDDESPKL